MTAEITLPPVVQPARVLVWVLHLALPVAGLWLLLARPATDLVWQHPPSHFWLVLAVALLNVVLGVRMSAAARRHLDARLFLVSLAFLSSAGFLLLHALATPGVVISHPNAGFDVAQPVGLAIAAGFAVASGLPLRGDRVFRLLVAVRAAVAALLVAWAAVSLLDLPPLNAPPPSQDVEGPLAIVAIAAVALYLLAAVRFYLLHRRAPAAMLLSLVTAFVLLAEAMVAVTLAVKWHLSWWEWHVLLTFAFGFVAYSAYVQYRREGSSAGLFDAVTLDQTARRIRAEYGAALEELVTALRERERTGGRDAPSLAARLAQRFGLTEGQTAVLDRAGAALAAERELTERLAALVDAGEQARVGLAEPQLLAQSLARIRPAFGDVQVGLISSGQITLDGQRYDAAALSSPGPHRVGDATLYPLYVRERLAGVLRVPTRDAPGGAPADATLSALATQLQITLENTRLYRELGTLFRQYLSPDVAAALLADPDQAALGGSVLEVTALFADLRGFTAFSEFVDPPEIVRMLNRYHSVAVPCILDSGGTIVQFVGDALLALFNAPARQPDHALRAVRAAMLMQEAVEAIARTEPDWPRLRVGANTGPALVGNIGSEALRGFNAMGDAVNVAARLQALAEPGQVVIGAATLAQLDSRATVKPLGEHAVKGRQQPVTAFVVTGLAR